MGGNCYEAAIMSLLDIARQTGHNEIGRVCHGEPLGEAGPPKGLRFGHAWVEVGSSLVIDDSNGKEWTGLKADYYRRGAIHPAEVRRYTLAEVQERVEVFGHTGPWHPDRALHATDPDSIPDCPDCRIGHKPGLCAEAQRLMAATTGVR